MVKRKIPSSTLKSKKRNSYALEDSDSMMQKGRKLTMLMDRINQLPDGPKKTNWLRSIEAAKEKVDAALKFRDKMRTNALNIGRPVHKIAKTGLNILNAADKGLEKLEQAEIPIISDLAESARSIPGYDNVMTKAKEGEKYLDKGTEFLKKADDFAMSL